MNAADRVPAGWVRHYDFRLGDRPVGTVLEVDVGTGADQRGFRLDDGEVAVIDWGGGQATSHLLDVEPIHAP